MHALNYTPFTSSLERDVASIISAETAGRGDSASVKEAPGQSSHSDVACQPKLICYFDSILKLVNNGKVLYLNFH